jgi:hypothetical protein
MLVAFMSDSNIYMVSEIQPISQRPLDYSISITHKSTIYVFTYPTFYRFRYVTYLKILRTVEVTVQSVLVLISHILLNTTAFLIFRPLKH